MRTLFLLILLLPRMVMADVFVRSPFYFPISPADYKQVLEKYDPLKDLNSTHIDTIHITQPYKTSISGVDFSFDAVSRVVAKEQVGQFSFSIDVNGVNANINHIVTDDVISIQSGVVFITAKLNGQCSGMQLQGTNSSLKINGSLSANTVGGRLVFQINDLNLTGQAQWDISTQSCDGPQNYQAKLEAAILEMMSSNESVKGLIMQSLNSAVNTMSDKINSQILNVMTSKVMNGVDLALTPHVMDLDHASGWLMVQGEVTAKLVSSSHQDVFVEAPLTENDDFTSSGLLVSQEYMLAVVKHMHEQSYIKYGFMAQDIKSLSSLLNNRLYQFFLWADLRNFEKNTNFSFLAKAKDAPKLKFVSNDKGFVWYNIQDQVSVDMNAPKNNQMIPYMNFQSPVDVNSWLGVSGGRLFLGFAEPKMNLKADWDESYIQKFNPLKYISTSFFNGKIKKAVKDYQYNMALPKMDLNSMSLQAQSFKASNKWLQVTYKPVAK